MTVVDWVVVVAGIGAIGWVNWYFFVAPRADGGGSRTADGAAAKSASDR